MRYSIEVVRDGGFIVRDEGMSGALLAGTLGDCLDYIERKLLEADEQTARDQTWVDDREAWDKLSASLVPLPIGLFEFAKQGQIGPVTESNP